MKEIKRIILKSGKDQSLKRKHPWVFSGAIKKMYGQPLEGDLVEVFDNKNGFLALGHFQPGSIAVRILSFRKTIPDLEFWTSRISSAFEYRKSMGLVDREDTNVYRLIHAEGDDLPGMIADYYDGVLVLQFHSVGMYLARDMIIEAVSNVLGQRLRGVYCKSGKTLPFKAGIRDQDGWLVKPKDFGTIKENGHLFKVDWEKGQKTGFFIDQRENRLLAGGYSKGRNVLNMFGYTGGFSVYALKGGAALVHTVDSSNSAVALADQNVLLNEPDCRIHRSFMTDAFDFLEQPAGNYDLIILDPPAFAKHQNVLPQALQGYKRLNLKALRIIRPGGLLFSFSCSQAVSKENFRKSVFVAAATSGRKVRILHQLHQALDHPVNIYHPEGEYLKGLVLYVE